MRVHRQPRERDGRARREGRHALLRVRARGPGAREDPRHRGLRREGRRGQGQLRRREPPVQRGRRGAAVGVREREHAARTTRRARSRSGSRPPSSSAGACPTTSWCPIASGRAPHEDPPRVQRADRDRRGRGEAVPRLRRAARGMSPGRAGVPGRRRGGHAGEAGHDRALARDRDARRRVVRDEGRAPDRRPHRVVHRAGDPSRGSSCSPAPRACSPRPPAASRSRT